MAEYLSPAVYVEELPGAKPIEGVGTSTGAFVGIAEKGPVNSPQLITNFSQFRDVFGGFREDAFLAYSIQHFFNEGGTRCYVVRSFKNTSSPTSTNPKPDVAKIDLRLTAEATSEIVLTAYAASAGTWGNGIYVKAAAPGFDANDPTNTLKKFKLQVYHKAPEEAEATLVETFDQLSMNEFVGTTDVPNKDHVERRINGTSKYITVVDLSTDRSKIDPPVFSASAVALSGGSNGASLVPNDLIGAAATSSTPASGLYAFNTVDDISIVSIPDLVNPSFSSSAARDAVVACYTYCETRKDCFFVADTPSGLSPQDALNYKRGLTPFTGNAFKSKYGALYYPWIYITDPKSGARKLFPPSGAVVGSYAAADVRVGVHKAPAGTEDGYLNSAVEVERVITKGEHDTLNPEGVNVIRKFPDAGIVLWGARTVSTDAEWKYINVRRLFIFLEKSILKGTQWVVFEPNDSVLWKKIRRDIGAFLRIQWLEGKLVGDKAEKAFFVKCDEETNPPESVDLGRVITVIGLAPSKPAEFVIFRLMQSRGGADVSE